MKWYVIVLFLSIHEDGMINSFIFNKPVFADRSVCMATLTNKIEIEKYVDTILHAYKGKIPGPIQKVNCIDENAVTKILELNKKDKGLKI